MQLLLNKLTMAKPAIKGTTLITYLIPSNFNLWLARQHINKELSSAQNIKSKKVRKAVISALKSIQIKLNDKKNADNKNGLIVLAGEILQTDQYI